MSSRRPRPRYAIALVLTAVAALLVAPGTAGATAGARPGRVPVGLPLGLKADEFVLHPDGGLGVSSVIECTGRSHNPHPSAHNPGWVRGQGETTCTAPVAEIHVQPELYEWIPDYGWYLTSIGPGHTELGRNTVRSSAEDLCPDEPIYFATVSYHHVKFPPGYEPSTGSGRSSSAAVAVVC